MEAGKSFAEGRAGTGIVAFKTYEYVHKFGLISDMDVLRSAEYLVERPLVGRDRDGGSKQKRLETKRKRKVGPFCIVPTLCLIQHGCWRL